MKTVPWDEELLVAVLKLRFLKLRGGPQAGGECGDALISMHLDALT